MRILIFLVLVIQGVLVSAEVKNVELGGVEIPVIYEKDSSLPIVSMQIIFKNSGSISDNIEGIAKISAALLNEGTKKLGSTKFATKLENRAINLSSSVGVETFVIETSALKEEFSNAISYTNELLLDPNYKEDTLKKLKTLALGRIKQKQSDFDYIASTNLKKELFKDTPIANSFDGTESSIEQIKLKDVKEFIKNSLVLSRVIIVVGGDIEFDEVQKYLKLALSSLKKGKNLEMSTYEVSKNAQDVNITKDTQQAYIYFGSPYNLAVNDKDAYKSKVAAFILGSSGFGSRLMEEVRVKRGLAYSAYARINLSKNSNYFSGYLQTKLESQEEAMKVVKDEIAKFVEAGVSEDELKKAKQFILGSEPLRVETLSQRLSRSFNEYYHGFSLGHSKEELKNIETLGLQELNDFIKAHEEINRVTFSIVNKQQ